MIYNYVYRHFTSYSLILIIEGNPKGMRAEQSGAHTICFPSPCAFGVNSSNIVNPKQIRPWTPQENKMLYNSSSMFQGCYLRPCM